MAQRGFGFNSEEVAELELAYLGGLLGLDVYVDEPARAEALEKMSRRPKASPERRG